MRFIAILLIATLAACTSEEETQPQQNGTKYEATVILDGVTNRVEGTLYEDDYWDFHNLISTNIPMVFTSLGSTNLAIIDSNNANLIEGYPLSLSLHFNSNDIGETPVSISMRPYGSDFYADKYPALADVSTKAYLVADTSIDWASYESIKPYTPSLKLGTTMTLTDSGTNVMIQDGETLSNTINGIDTATGRAVKVKLGESQKGFMKKTKLFFVEEHLIINGKDVIKWSQPIDVEFSFKAIRRFF